MCCHPLGVGVLGAVMFTFPILAGLACPVLSIRLFEDSHLAHI